MGCKDCGKFWIAINVIFHNSALRKSAGGCQGSGLLEPILGLFNVRFLQAKRRRIPSACYQAVVGARPAKHPAEASEHRGHWALQAMLVVAFVPSCRCSCRFGVRKKVRLLVAEHLD